MENSPLKKLPVELRLRIYELALYHPNTIVVANVRNSKGRLDTRAIVDVGDDRAVYLYTHLPHQRLMRTTFYKNLLALQTTCKQIRDESMPVFMEINSFRLEGLEMEKVHEPLAATWLRAMKQWTHYLKCVEVCLGTVGSMYVERHTMPVKHIIDIKRICKGFNIRPSLTVLFPFAHPCEFPPPHTCGRRYIARFDGNDKEATQKRFLECSRDEETDMIRPGIFYRSQLQASSKHIRTEMTKLLTELDESPEWTWDWDRAPPAPARR